MSNVCHVAKAQKREGDENERLNNPVSFSRISKIADEGMTSIVSVVANLSGNIESFNMEMEVDANQVKGAMNNLNSKMDMGVQLLRR